MFTTINALYDRIKPARREAFRRSVVDVYTAEIDNIDQRLEAIRDLDSTDVSDRNLEVFAKAMFGELQYRFFLAELKSMREDPDDSYSLIEHLEFLLEEAPKGWASMRQDYVAALNTVKQAASPRRVYAKQLKEAKKQRRMLCEGIPIVN